MEIQPLSAAARLDKAPTNATTDLKNFILTNFMLSYLSLVPVRIVCCLLMMIETSPWVCPPSYKHFSNRTFLFQQEVYKFISSA